MRRSVASTRGWVIFETKPTVLIETGSFAGGSSLFFAHQFDTMGLDGRIISIDTQPHGPPLATHERICFIRGSSVDWAVGKKVRSLLEPSDKVMAIFDSNHTTEHVYKEMLAYWRAVSVGCYMIVQDTNLGGNPVVNDVVPGEGPAGAVKRFLAENDCFQIDKSKERYYMTFYPGGWLRKIRDESESKLI
jgi:cephalosporin hydroxylase